MVSVQNSPSNPKILDSELLKIPTQKLFADHEILLQQDALYEWRNLEGDFSVDAEVRASHNMAPAKKAMPEVSRVYRVERRHSSHQ